MEVGTNSDLFIGVSDGTNVAGFQKQAGKGQVLGKPLHFTEAAGLPKAEDSSVTVVNNADVLLDNATPNAESSDPFAATTDGVAPKWFEVIVRIQPATNTIVMAQTHGDEMPALAEVPFSLNPAAGLSLVSYADDSAESYGIFVLETSILEDA